MYFHFHNNPTLSQWRAQKWNNRNVLTCGKSGFFVRAGLQLAIMFYFSLCLDQLKKNKCFILVPN